MTKGSASLASIFITARRDVEETAQQGIALQRQERVGDLLPFGHLDMHDGRDVVKKCGACSRGRLVLVQGVYHDASRSQTSAAATGAYPGSPCPLPQKCASM
jgi:hypothetical protein